MQAPNGLRYWRKPREPANETGKLDEQAQAAKRYVAQRPVHVVLACIHEREIDIKKEYLNAITYKILLLNKRKIYIPCKYSIIKSLLD